MIVAIRTGVTVGVVALAGAACSFSIGGDPSSTSSSTSSKSMPLEYSKVDLEQQLSRQIKDQNPNHEVSVTCPTGLPKQNGASEQCLLTSENAQYPVTVTIKGVGSADGASADWEIGPRISGS